MAAYAHGGGASFDTSMVYVGNIAWEVDPDTIFRLLNEVAPVVEFKCVAPSHAQCRRRSPSRSAALCSMRPDPLGARRHRGAGHARFRDPSGASAAIASLNGRMLNGRAMRVAVLDPDRSATENAHATAGAYATRAPATAPVAAMSMVAPSAPVSLASGVPARGGLVPVGVKAVVNALGLSEAWDVLREMKQLADEDAAATEALLTQYPTLACACMMLCERLGVLKELPGEAGGPGAPSAIRAAVAAATNASRVPLLPTPAGHPGGAPASVGAPAHASSAASGVSVAGLAVTAGAPPAPASEEDAQAAQLIQSILMMSDAEVAAMPEDQRESALIVRDAVRIPLARLRATQPPERLAQLMQLREQLQGMGFHVVA